MVSPPRDIDMTSQMEGSEGHVAMLDHGKTTSLVQMETRTEEFKEHHSEFQRYSTTQEITTEQVTRQQLGSGLETFQGKVTEVRGSEELSSEKNSSRQVLVETRTQEESTVRSDRMKSVQQNNFMVSEVVKIEGGEVASPTRWKQTEAQVRSSGSADARAAEELKTKSGAKAPAAFQASSTRQVVSTYEE